MATATSQSALVSFSVFEDLMRPPDTATIARRRRQQRIVRQIAILKRKQSRRKAALIFIVTQFLIQLTFPQVDRSTWTFPR